MKRSHIPRRWRWIKAVGTGLCLSLGALYGLSLVRTSGLRVADNFIVFVVSGGVAISSLTDGLASLAMEFEGTNGRFFSRPRYEDVMLGFHGGPYSWNGGWTAFVPFWAPLLLSALPTAYAWHRCRRFPPGRCQKCGYDLAGNTTGVCPECGKPANTRGAA